MKMGKKIIAFSLISVLILCISQLVSLYISAVICTLWIVFVIVHYGIKGGMIFTFLMGVFMVWYNKAGTSSDQEIIIIGFFTYCCISVGIGLPIDLMKREHANRIASEERLRRITDNMRDVIIQIDRQGVIQYISPSCTRNFGYPSEFYIGKSFYEGLYSDDCQTITERIENAFTTKCFSRMEYRYLHKNGHFVWVESLGEVIFNDKSNTSEIVINCREITDRRKSEDRITYLNFHDTLTGLYNRTFFEEELKRLLQEKVLPLSIIIGDVNGLKLTNDVFGHYEGDRLLCKTARILKNSCRRDDIVVRWGGDEFAILLPGADEEAALLIINRINNSCNVNSNELVKLSMALGTATRKSDTEEMRVIIKEAEEKMYRHKLLESRSVRSNIIASLEETLFERNYETKEHANRMMEMAQKFGAEIGLTEHEQDELRLLALLHDIGKIAVNDSILGKPGKLTEDEWKEMRKHPEIGYRIAQSTQELCHIANYILSHHERWDGSGYPQGLKGEKIPKLSRILLIIDAYDVMTHVRSYKDAINSDKALDEIKRCTGTQFDPELAAIFVNMLGRESGTREVNMG